MLKIFPNFKSGFLRVVASFSMKVVKSIHNHPRQNAKFSASELHKIGGKLREKDNLEESLTYETLALVKFIKNKDYKNVVDTLQARFLTWKHMFLLSKDIVILELAKKDAQASLSIAERLKIKNIYSKCYFRMGEACMLADNYEDAMSYYSKALHFFKGSLSEKGDYRYHLGVALYRSGKKDEGYKTMLNGLSEIEEGKGRVDSFLYNVWKTGCLMRMAEMLKTDKPAKAREYIRLAENIINKDKRMVIRKRQLKEIKRTF
jgi:tetratricopeptide (TPR) repeat protein